MKIVVVHANSTSLVNGVRLMTESV